MGGYEKLKMLNERCRNILNIIQKNGPITKNEIINRTGMKLTTLNRDIQVLIDNKIVMETATAESTGGRKPVLYDVNMHEFYSIGIDISRTYTQIVITDLKMNIIREKLINGSYDVNDVLDDIEGHIESMLKELKINKSEIIGIGIGIVGGFNVDTLKNRLSQIFNIPVYADNGANMAVIGEYFFGIGRGSRNIVYINCGVGIRTGVISSGVLIRTINNSEDAFAHMIVDAGGEPCSCGNSGCVESYASILKIAKKFTDKNKNSRNINYIDVCNLAENKESTAFSIIMDAARHFGIGLSNYIRLLNPHIIILSGPLIKHSRLFYDECKKTAAKECHIDGSSIVFNRGGYFKNKSIAVGSSAMAVEMLINPKWF